MPLDPHVRRFLDMMAMGVMAKSETGAGDVAGRRESLRVLARLAAGALPPVEASARALPLPAGPCAARLYVPAEAEATGPGLVFFHGGGLVAGDLDTHDGICRGLAAAAGCRIVSVAYRLAPEHPFPAGLEDAIAAFAHVAGTAGAFGIDPARLAIGGDSAGAGLAARVAQELRGTAAAIAAQLLICPVLDLRCATSSHRDFEEGYFLDGRTVRADMAACGVAGRAEDPRVSPLLEPDLSGLPPAQIHTAEFDIVRDDGAAYAERLTRAGIPATYACHAGMIHFFYGLGRLVPKSQTILTEIGSGFGPLLRGASAARPDLGDRPSQRRAS
ncbi:alpha/beta hydrolase [Methylobacterium organophilum]|uniref:Acetyl esterase n=1 Tax=Methylobacterium organophilum TaxID=410 RepID=A0ABQ4T9P1_METOR|nr:alpha/beta hydrolase [Methylobacterium organophilum]GJE27719.1 Acetyl esterase [Methylobacterium organophilum]